MRKYNTASIRHGYHCAVCDWPIIDACCNDSFNDFKDASEWDWWLYCSNKGCVNHEGEGVWQQWPSWVVRDDPRENIVIPDDVVGFGIRPRDGGAIIGFIPNKVALHPPHTDAYRTKYDEVPLMLYREIGDGKATSTTG